MFRQARREALATRRWRWRPAAWAPGAGTPPPVASSGTRPPHNKRRRHAGTDTGARDGVERLEGVFRPNPLRAPDSKIRSRAALSELDARLDPAPDPRRWRGRPMRSGPSPLEWREQGTRARSASRSARANPRLGCLSAAASDTYEPARCRRTPRPRSSGRRRTHSTNPFARIAAARQPHALFRGRDRIARCIYPTRSRRTPGHEPVGSRAGWWGRVRRSHTDRGTPPETRWLAVHGEGRSREARVGERAARVSLFTSRRCRHCSRRCSSVARLEEVTRSKAGTLPLSYPASRAQQGLPLAYFPAGGGVPAARRLLRPALRRGDAGAGGGGGADERVHDRGGGQRAGPAPGSPGSTVRRFGQARREALAA